MLRLSGCQDLNKTELFYYALVRYLIFSKNRIAHPACEYKNNSNPVFFTWLMISILFRFSLIYQNIHRGQIDLRYKEYQSYYKHYPDDQVKNPTIHRYPVT